jgi:hypothetical protein
MALVRNINSFSIQLRLRKIASNFIGAIARNAGGFIHTRNTIAIPSIGANISLRIASRSNTIRSGTSGTALDARYHAYVDVLKLQRDGRLQISSFLLKALGKRINRRIDRCGASGDNRRSKAIQR